MWFGAATERKHGFSSTPHALKRNSRLNPLMPLLCRGARYSPAGGRMARGLLYLGSARFHFFLTEYFPKAKWHISKFRVPHRPIPHKNCLSSVGTMNQNLKVQDLLHLGPLGNGRRLPRALSLWGTMLVYLGWGLGVCLASVALVP